MKLLLDQNLSYRLIKLIEHDFPNSEQVRRLGLENSNDLQILKFAKENNFSIVTFDSDFRDFSSFYGHPPKIIWLRIGNRTTIAIANLLLEKKDIITDFLTLQEFKDLSCLELREGR